MKVKCAPDNAKWAFEMTPVDFLVKAIVLFASNPSHFGRVYNVVQADPVPAKIVFDLMKNKGFVSEYVSVEDWISRLYARAEEDNDYILNVLAQSLSDVEQYLTDESVYDCSRFNRALRDHGMERPSTDLRYFEKMIV